MAQRGSVDGRGPTAEGPYNPPVNVVAEISMALAAAWLPRHRDYVNCPGGHRVGCA